MRLLEFEDDEPHQIVSGEKTSLRELAISELNSDLERKLYEMLGDILFLSSSEIKGLHLLRNKQTVTIVHPEGMQFKWTWPMDYFIYEPTYECGCKVQIVQEALQFRNLAKLGDILLYEDFKRSEGCPKCMYKGVLKGTATW